MSNYTPINQYIRGNGHVFIDDVYTGCTSANLGSHHPMLCRILVYLVTHLFAHIS